MRCRWRDTRKELIRWGRSLGTGRANEADAGQAWRRIRLEWRTATQEGNRAPETQVRRTKCRKTDRKWKVKHDTCRLAINMRPKTQTIKLVFAKCITKDPLHEICRRFDLSHQEKHSVQNVHRDQALQEQTASQALPSAQ